MSVEESIHADMRGRSTPRGSDGEIAALAERQHGVVARGQLLRLGLRGGAIDRRVAGGRLHVVHPGVYAVGHRVLSQRARWMAGVLAAGPGAVLSHRAAAALWGVHSATIVEVTAPGRVRRPGITAHRARIAPDERTMRDGIPTTTVARTILDLASVLRERRLARAVNEAEYLRLTDTVSLEALIARHPKRRGIRTLKRIRFEPRLTRSETERAFLAFIDRRGLPKPQTNINVEGFECDAVWPHARLVAELDSRPHTTAARFESDRARDRALTAAGWRPIRITDRQLTREADALAGDLRRLLGAQA